MRHCKRALTGQRRRATRPSCSHAHVVWRGTVWPSSPRAPASRCRIEPRRAKGFAGALVERLLGASAGSTSAPDFAALGIELKTIPLDVDGRPRESTFVCCVPLREIAETEWESSGVARKLARVLWLPIEADRALPYGGRRVGSPRLWSPNTAERDALRADWEELAARIARGEGDRLSARIGRCLQMRPKAANARVLGRGSTSTASRQGPGRAASTCARRSRRRSSGRARDPALVLHQRRATRDRARSVACERVMRGRFALRKPASHPSTCLVAYSRAAFALIMV